MANGHSSAAINNNEKIFPVFAQRLASTDPSAWIAIVKKLMQWLRSERAYYPAAQPKIVELLEISYNTLTQALLTDPSGLPVVEVYHDLARAVVPFMGNFTDGELRARLQMLMQKTDDLLNDLSQSTTPIPLGALGPSLAQQGPSSSTQMLLNCSCRCWAVIHDRICLTIKTQSNMSTTAVPPQTAPRLKPTRSRKRMMTDANLPDAPIIPKPTPDNAANAEQPIPRPGPSKPQRRTTELSHHLLARDIDWFMANKQSSASASATPSIEAQTLPCPSSATPPIKVEEEQVTPNSLHITASPKPCLPRMRPTRPKPQGQTPASELAQSSPEPSSPIDDPGSSGDFHDAIEMDVDLPVLDVQRHDDEDECDVIQLERLDSDVVNATAPAMGVVSVEVDAAPQGNKSGHDDTSWPLEAPGTYDETGTTATGEQDQMAGVELTSQEGDLVSAEVSSNALPSGLGEETPATEVTDPSRPIEQGGMELVTQEENSTSNDTLPGPQGGVVSSGEQTAIPSEISFVAPERSVYSPRPMPPASPTQVSERDDAPSGTGSPRPRSTAAVCLEDDDASQGRFGDEMQVMFSGQGTTVPKVITIEFTFDDTLWSLVSRWVNRKSAPENLSESVCVSLACYSVPDIQSILQEYEETPSIVQVTPRAQCSWPQTGLVSLQAKRGEKDFHIPLSPPFFLTPAQCVDVSSFTQLGKNTLLINQLCDASEYMFVLHAHYPTRAQLAALAAEKRRMDEQWAQSLSALKFPKPRAKYPWDKHAIKIAPDFKAKFAA
ncbi:hypothetical protein BV22DRAFT_1050031 [Leucogyrophana mollusca]|uniref:Uncharacterized protein n=1 Tax=Leucogyrophana mollusca TaxID=85980 RepID=A0ACB8B7N2_9AGAM|nr:hypothetical protein BV22DRAFT_1050031 [Leucogyrophana mollusca]